MAPHELLNSSISNHTETFVLREESTVTMAENSMNTISSMGMRPQSLSLMDLAEDDGADAEHDLRPVQEYYSCNTPLSSIQSNNQTAATSAASSISSSFSPSVRLLKSPSLYKTEETLETRNTVYTTPTQQTHHQPLHMQDSSQDTTARRRLSLSPHKTKAQVWEERLKPMLLKYLHDEQVEYFHQLHLDHKIAASLRVVESLAYLASSPSFQEDVYFEHIYTMALFWSSKRQSRSIKLACLQTLMQCLSPKVAGWQHVDPVIEGTLDFFVTPHMEWEFMDHTEMNLLLELRALCLCFTQQEEARIRKVAQTGDTAAVLISASAKLMEEGMIQSGLLLETQLDKACLKLKRWVKPTSPLIVDQNAIMAKALSSAAVRASEEVKDSTLWLLQNARDASCRGLELAAKKLDETTNGSHRSLLDETLSPESAEALKAVSKVGMATLGATALVGEAMVETSRALVKKTGSVAADIVEHKYGSDAGQVVLDASETADNLVRAASNVALLEHKVLAKSMAKEVGKDQIELEIARAKDSLHLLEIQMAGMIHQALGNGPAANTSGKLLEGMKLLQQAQPTTASSSSIKKPSVGLKGSVETQQAVMQRV